MKQVLLTLMLCALMAAPALGSPTFRFTHSELLGLAEVYDNPSGNGDLAGVTDVLGNYNGMTSMLGQVGYWGNLAGNSEIWIGDSPVGGRDLSSYSDYALKLHYTPGHTDDIVCFAIADDNRVIVGDAIFEGGPGHTSSPQAFETTLQTLREIILTWPDSTVCYPGHGVAFRLGDQRAAIEAFLSKDHGRFFGDATWDM